MAVSRRRGDPQRDQRTPSESWEVKQVRLVKMSIACECERGTGKEGERESE